MTDKAPEEMVAEIEKPTHLRYGEFDFISYRIRLDGHVYTVSFSSAEEKINGWDIGMLCSVLRDQMISQHGEGVVPMHSRQLPLSPETSKGKQ